MANIKRIVLFTAFGFGAAVIALGSIAQSSQQSPATTSAVASAPSAPALIGDQGVLISPAMGCPQEDDTKTFVSSYVKAGVVGDSVGQSDAIAAAVQAGCQPMHPGDTGLVIDAAGFLEGYVDLRLADGSSVWIQTESVGDLSGPMHHS